MMKLSQASQHRCYTLLFVLLLAGCVSTPIKQVKDECAGLQSMTQRFNCYRDDIDNLITSQLDSDYRDYVSDAKDSADPESRAVFNGVTVEVTLLPNGTVERVTFLEAGRNTYFDNMVERAIEKAGPFFMPVDKQLQNMLLEFRYSIEVE